MISPVLKLHSVFTLARRF